MRYESVFDIIGPIMIGPSSSHTAGAVRIGMVARALFGHQPQRVDVKLYGSFARTYRGHGTDVALVGGVLGFDTYDARLPKALALAREIGVEVSIQANQEAKTSHPNTAKLCLYDRDQHLEIMGVSTGGGRIEITEVDGFRLRLQDNYPAVLVFHQDSPGAIAAVTAVFADDGANIAHMEVSRRDPSGLALMIIETDQSPSPTIIEKLKALPNVSRVDIINTWHPEPPRPVERDIAAIHKSSGLFSSISELVAYAESEHISLSDAVIRQESELSGLRIDDLLADMDRHLIAMEDSVKVGLAGGFKSVSQLTGGDARLLRRYLDAGDTLSGNTVLLSAADSLAVGETNAAMGRICAAPTAGAAGVMAGVLLGLATSRELSRIQMLRFLFCAGGCGLVLANRAYISGAAGGCQAEIGSGAAMAAAAAVEMAKGSPSQSAHAMAIALKSLLGLACDPVAGLVEVPCIKRNGIAAGIALLAADMALAGIESKIPCDDVIGAMRKIGDSMPKSLKETAEGGLADTPTGRSIEQTIVAQNK